MPAKLVPDSNAARRFAGDLGLVDAEALVRETLARTLGGVAGDRLRPSGGPGARDAAAGLANGGLPPALQGMLDRFAAATPAMPLCETTVPGRPRASVPVPDRARFEEHVHQGAAGSLAYKLYVPSTAEGRAVPLVVMLHGCTQSPDDFAAGTRMNEVAEEHGFLVAYPRQTPSANMQKCWNWFEARDQGRDGGEPALIAGLTREIMRQQPVDPARIYVAGLSAGGAAAAIMGQAYPDLYAAVGVHSGLAAGAASDMPSALTAMRQGGSLKCGGLLVPTIVFHSDRDRTVHPANGDQVLDQARAGASLTSSVSREQTPGGLAYTRTTRSDASGRSMLELWTVHGAGHAWAGGSQAGSYTEPRGPDASREMVRFFLQHANLAIAH